MLTAFFFSFNSNQNEMDFLILVIVVIYFQFDPAFLGDDIMHLIWSFNHFNHKALCTLRFGCISSFVLHKAPLCMHLLHKCW